MLTVFAVGVSCIRVCLVADIFVIVTCGWFLVTDVGTCVGNAGNFVRAVSVPCRAHLSIRNSIRF